MVFPSVPKGFSLGIHFLKKRGSVFFWGKKRYENYERYFVGENLYRVKYQEQYIPVKRHPTYLYAMSGEVFPSVPCGLRKDMRIMKDI